MAKALIDIADSLCACLAAGYMQSVVDEAGELRLVTETALDGTVIKWTYQECFSKWLLTFELRDRAPDFENDRDALFALLGRNSDECLGTGNIYTITDAGFLSKTIILDGLASRSDLLNILEDGVRAIRASIPAVVRRANQHEDEPLSTWIRA